MPFDTTYHLDGSSETLINTYKVPGGKDTDIYLAPGQLPPGMDISTKAATDSIMEAIRKEISGSQSENAPPPKFKPYNPGTGMYLFFIVLFLAAVYFIRRNLRSDEDEESTGSWDGDKATRPKPSYLKYYGDELGFTDEMIIESLTKYFSYYNKLVPADKERFVHRVKNFMAEKTFLIHALKGFREMPILISASAIQLTFGLKKYLLPNYTRIHIYPEEYVAASTLHIIEGNVQGNTISFSWKHFLDGYSEPGNGQNVGLHEMAHALYAQTFLVEEHADRNFENNYQEFNSYGKEVFDKE